MKKILANPWTKRAASVLTLFYGVLLFMLAYFSVFYTIEIYEKAKFGIVLSLGCLLMFAIMFYTRKQVITTIVSTLPLPLLLPIVLLNLGEWEMVIPLVLVSISMFFLCGAGEGGKTVIGTIILLVYMLGALAYFFYTTMLSSTIESSIAQSGVSPSGEYRYAVVHTMDQCNGSTYVEVEPNTFDRSISYMYCKSKGYERRMFVTRPAKEVAVEWKTERRSDITASILALQENVTLTLNEQQFTKLGMDKGHKEDVPVQNLSEKQLTALKIVLPDTSGKKVNVPAGMRLYQESTINLTLEQMHEIGWAATLTVSLSELTDAQLTSLGVPEQGDVMYVDGKAQFRYYIAILERYFTKKNRQLELL